MLLMTIVYLVSVLLYIDLTLRLIFLLVYQSTCDLGIEEMDLEQFLKAHNILIKKQ